MENSIFLSNPFENIRCFYEQGNKRVTNIFAIISHRAWMGAPSSALQTSHLVQPKWAHHSPCCKF
jgi:hypothetical protein